MGIWVGALPYQNLSSLGEFFSKEEFGNAVSKIVF